VRKVIAISLVLLFASATALPLVNQESRLPPCCRVGGKHHCAMMDRLLSDKNTSVRSPRERCPSWPTSTTVTSIRPYQPPSSALHAGEAVIHFLASSETSLGYVVSFNSTHLKRGPPLRNA
jgi:hypothetical protein